MSLIEKDEALKRVEDAPVLSPMSLITKSSIYADIKTMPDVDAVPVVRCKDCVYLGCIQCALANEYNQYRPGVDPDWFCAKGRRPKHETD